MIQTIRLRWPPGHQHWQIQEQTRAEPWAYQPHRHVGFGDLTLVCAGELTNIVNGHETVLPGGSVSWTREHDLHEVRGQNFRYLNINLPDEQLALLAMAIGREKDFRALQEQETTPVALPDRPWAQVEAGWTRLCQMPRGPAADLLVNELALGALGALLTPLLPGADAEGDWPLWLRRCMREIDRSLARGGISVSDLAAICDRSAEHISRSFSKYIGMSPSAWINKQRLARASLLLARTNREILDISYSVGFQSASYFYRLFRKEFGIPPRQYRRKHSHMH